MTVRPSQKYLETGNNILVDLCDVASKMRKTIQTLFLLLAMVDLSVYAFTPPGEPRQKLALSANDGLLIPSNVYIGLKATSTRLAIVHAIHADNEVQCNDAPNGTPADRTVSLFQRKRVQRHKKLKRYGNLPDVHWRAISMEHLQIGRAHV